MTTHEILVEARNLIDRAGWNKGGPDPEGTKEGHCLLGAVGYAAGARTYSELASAVMCPSDAPNGAVVKSAHKVLEGLAGAQFLWAWNDRQSSVEPVLVLLDKAIAATAPAPDVSFVADPTLPQPPVPVEGDPVAA